MRRGFTLIELLVVIAIIGILSAVVLSGLNTARSSGNDAAVKTNLASLRTQAEIFNDANGYAYAGGTGSMSAGAACPGSLPTNAGSNFSVMGNSTFYNAVMAAKSAGGLCAYISGSGYWAVAVQFKNSTFKAWCVDSTGIAKTILGGSLQTSAPYDAALLAGDISTAGCGS